MAVVAYVFDMRCLALILALSLAAVPATAQEPAPETPPGGMGEGLGLMERGVQMFLRGLMTEMEPALDDMAEGAQALAENIGPMLSQLMALVDDVRAYHPPERLPNGDIILRRKTPDEMAPPAEPETEGGAIDL